MVDPKISRLKFSDQWAKGVLSRFRVRHAIPGIAVGRGADTTGMSSIGDAHDTDADGQREHDHNDEHDHVHDHESDRDGSADLFNDTLPMTTTV